MCEPENMRKIAALKPDFFGLIFYPKSPRFVSLEKAQALPEFENIKRVGVFVDESAENILQIAATAKLSFVQLHGDETPAFCESLKKENLEIIKVFKVDDNFDGEILKEYEMAADYFLFDTKTIKHGGSGKSFDWEILRRFEINKPFFLGGGIGAENPLDAINACRDLPLFALDINSRAETAPGVKSARIVEEINNKLTTKDTKVTKFLKHQFTL